MGSIFSFRYPLLLTRIYRVTPRQNSDREALIQARRKIEEQITKINEVKVRYILLWSHRIEKRQKGKLLFQRVLLVLMHAKQEHVLPGSTILQKTSNNKGIS